MCGLAMRCVKIKYSQLVLSYLCNQHYTMVFHYYLVTVEDNFYRIGSLAVAADTLCWLQVYRGWLEGIINMVHYFF